MPMMTRTRVDELLAVEESDAWGEYLEATHGQQSARYEEVEPWAWERLQRKLNLIRDRRARLTGRSRRLHP